MGSIERLVQEQNTISQLSTFLPEVDAQPLQVSLPQSAEQEITHIREELSHENLVKVETSASSTVPKDRLSFPLANLANPFNLLKPRLSVDAGGGPLHPDFAAGFLGLLVVSGGIIGYGIAAGAGVGIGILGAIAGGAAPILLLIGAFYLVDVLPDQIREWKENRRQK